MESLQLNNKDSLISPPLRWEPELGDFTTQFLDGKSKDANGPSFEDLTQGEYSILQEAKRILGRCLPPSLSAAPETGLVVGYVQSGKTLSFETVIALARDNGYGVIIVLAGTKNNLRDQSEDRLKKDFEIEGSEDWYHLSNPSMSVKDQIESRLDAWKRRPSKKSLLITVLKHGGHLEKLATVFSKLDLVSVPCLIIDDESDQASLNTKAARIQAGLAAVTDVSTTYKSILKLRDVLPHHSYLQYTATPQANLLLAQTDFLNPNFAELVTPGDAYTGGKSFFIEQKGLVEIIPSQEIPSKNNVLKAPPKSLLKALRTFLLVASHHSLTRAKGRGAKDRNRSMMVHPAISTSSHKLYKGWIDNSLRTLRGMMPLHGVKPQAAIVNLFQEEYDSLKATCHDLSPLEDLLVEIAEEVFVELNVVEINGTKDAEEKVSWRSSPYWILVGGAKLDRGYTVEGLCITYMPRPLGTAPAADNLQQRARFFGYKLPYLNQCRVFLQSSVKDAFSEYIEHEECVREALISNRGKPLSQWRRDFILTQLLKPTRANVIGLGIRKIPVDGWLVPKVMHRDATAIESNRILLHTTVDKWAAAHGGIQSAAEVMGVLTSPHNVIEAVPLYSVLEDFLLSVQVRDAKDAEQHSAMLIALSKLLAEDDSLKVDIFMMNKLESGYRSRRVRNVAQGIDRYSPINQYFSQSADVKNDRAYCFKDRITLQLRFFDLGVVQREKDKADIKGVAWFAVNIPSSMRKSLVVEKR
ncbi:Z1 domain-containing protein [Pseudomonas putida]|uniref:Z1 domain-containing protein n=1 Tax=Pseudomonas putida TaxID=303 RepID=UPI0034D5F520